MTDDLLLRAQRPSPLLMILPTVGALFMAGLTVMSIANAFGASVSGVGIGLTLVMLAATLWLSWDVLKLTGLVPMARFELSDGEMVVRSSMFGILGRRQRFVLGQPVRIDAMSQRSLFMGTTGVYRIVQQEAQATIVGPGLVREQDMAALVERLAESDTPVQLTQQQLRRGPGPTSDR